MKRSEAVDYIVYHLKLMDDYNRFEDKELKERADLILTGLELRGMSPPPNPDASSINGLGQLCGWEYDGENHE
jgi:hypothetical protein